MIARIWSGESPLWRLLLPLSWLYGLVSGGIRLCYKLGIKRAWRAPVPVVVVGNLTAGGNGKTPVVIWLVEQLRQRGIRVGVVSRGYGGKAAAYPLLLTADTTTAEAGDEPVLIYPLFGVFFIGVFMYAVNPAMAAINTGIINLLNSMGGSSKILLGAIVAGMMSIDMGGPFNKAAYVFGTASIASGNYDVMAAVMIGGMIPPLAIALATTFFKKKFTADERKSGVVNYIMGLCFITEGAIPFAASDPLRVIPSCVIGSAVAGGLSMMFGCTLRAPHGGIFVFPVVGNVVGYLIALAAGAVVGMLMLGILKKNKTETK